MLICFISVLVDFVFMVRLKLSCIFAFAVFMSLFLNTVYVYVGYMKCLTLNIFSSMLDKSVRVKTGVCSVLGDFRLLSYFREFCMGCVVGFGLYRTRFL